MVPEKDRKYSKTSLFIRNIPSDCVDDEITEFFSNLGPLKSCFVVRPTKDDSGDISSNNQKRKHLFGFVQFVIPEDAQMILEKLKTGEILFRGSLKLGADFAKHRDRKAKKAESEKPDACGDIKDKNSKLKQIEWIKDKKNAARSILVQNLPASITKKQIYKKVKKYGKIVGQIEFPEISILYHPQSVSSESQYLAAKVTYTHADEAKSALSHLHNHIFKGQIIHAFPHPGQLSLPELKAKARIILRNIGFKISEEEIWKWVRPYGVVVEISMVSDTSKEKPTVNSHKGFAFVTMGSQDQAEKVIENLNEKSVLDGDNQSKSKRPVAIDWALPKDKMAAEDTLAPLEGSCESIEKEDNMSILNEDDAEKFDSPDVGCPSDQDNNSDEMEVYDGDEDTETTKFEDTKGAPTKNKVKLKKSDVFEGKTIFVRNVPFEATEEGLAECFSRFGKVLFAKLTIDKITELPKGTAFVKFSSSESAEEAIKASQVQDFSNISNLKTSSTLLPEADNAGISLHERSLKVEIAVSREEAKNIASKIEVESEKVKDKRNIYLLKEGLIKKDSKEAKDVPDAQLKVREDSYIARQKKLKKQLHLFVSRTRLSIRNLGKRPDEKWLKDLALREVDAWRQEMNSQLNSGAIGKSEKQELKTLKSAENGLDHPIKIKQIKIVRDKTKISPAWVAQNSQESPAKKRPLVPKHVSLGYGFIEFRYHAHALAFLRRVNNNPNIISGGRRPLVEFAIENSSILQKRKAAQQNVVVEGDSEKRSNTKKGPKRVKTNKV